MCGHLVPARYSCLCALQTCTYLYRHSQKFALSLSLFACVLMCCTGKPLFNNALTSRAARRSHLRWSTPCPSPFLPLRSGEGFALHADGAGWHARAGAAGAQGGRCRRGPRADLHPVRRAGPVAAGARVTRLASLVRIKADSQYFEANIVLSPSICSGRSVDIAATVLVLPPCKE